MAYIEKRGNSYSVIYWYDDESGAKKQKRVSGFPTKEDAMAAVKEMRMKSAAGIDVNGDRQTCGQIMERWFAEHCPHLAGTTKAKYSAAMDRLEKLDIYSMPVRRVKPATLSALIAQLESGQGGARPISTRTALSLTEPLRLSLSWAVRQRLIPSNPLEGAAIPKTQKRQQAILSDEDVRDLVSASKDHPFRTPILLALYGGLRREEVAALRWQDIDFPRRTVTIRQAIALTSQGREILKDTKNTTSARTISMPRFVLDEVAQLPRTNERVCTAPGGAPYRLGSYSQAVRRLIQRINNERAAANAKAQADANEKKRRLSPDALKSPMPNATYHDLRHTHAAMLIRMGVQPKVIQERLGHASIKMTMDLYGYLMPGLQQSVADALDAEFQTIADGNENGNKCAEKPDRAGA